MDRVTLTVLALGAITVAALVGFVVWTNRRDRALNDRLAVAWEAERDRRAVEEEERECNDLIAAHRAARRRARAS